VAAREIAEEKVMGERSKVKAKAVAEALAAKLKAGGKLEDLVPKETIDTTGQDPQVAALMKKLNDTPKLNETEMFPRKGNSIPEIGVSKELSKKAFEMKVGEIAGPFEVGGAYVVVK